MLGTFKLGTFNWDHLIEFISFGFISFGFISIAVIAWPMASPIRTLVSTSRAVLRMISLSMATVPGWKSSRMEEPPKAK